MLPVTYATAGPDLYSALLFFLSFSLTLRAEEILNVVAYYNEAELN